jgi:hypothetical protein
MCRPAFGVRLELFEVPGPRSWIDLLPDRELGIRVFYLALASVFAPRVQICRAALGAPTLIQP